MKNLILTAATALAVAAPISAFAADALQGADRVVVLEDVTAVECGWCPRGIALCELMTERHPDSFIALAYHDLDFNPEVPEPMGSEEVQGYIRHYSSFFRGRPTAFINRDFNGTDYCMVSMSVSGMAAQAEIDYASIRAAGSFAGMTMEAEAIEGEALADVRVTVDFVLDLPRASSAYAVSLIITEDNVGPYKQKNFYSNSSANDCGGWEERASRPNVLHQHVVRAINGIDGIRGSIPAGLSKGDTHTFTQTISTKAVAGDECKIVALLIDTLTGRIENACSVPLILSSEEPVKPEKPVEPVEPDEPAEPAEPENPEAALSEIESEEAAVSAVDGGIEVKGFDGQVAVYNPQGVCVSVTKGGGAVKLLPGLYYVATEGNVFKVLIR